MAAVAESGSTSGRRDHARSGPFWFKLLAWAGLLGVVAALIALGVTSEAARRGLNWSLVPWVLVVGLAGVMPLRLRRVEFVVDLPLLLASAMVLGPLGSGIVALCGATDVRELRLEMSIRFVWNRVQTAICTIAAALVFQAASVGLGNWPETALAGFVALGVDIVLNYILVSVGAALLHGWEVRSVLREMRVGSQATFVWTHVAIGFIGVLIAETYRSAGVFGLLASIVPVALAYQSLRRRRELDETRLALATKDEAVRAANRRIAEERREERLVVAGALHDDVLPPLFKVHLMGQVLSRDLSAGRLLDLDRDVPELLEATDVAQGAIRGVLRNLRRATIGPEGLRSALELIVRESGLRNVHLDVTEIDASPAAQLIVYQVVREALGNVAKHADGSPAVVSVWVEGGQLRATIQDEGPGFVAGVVDRSLHFGLELMAERVSSVGGELAIDSKLGNGTCVAVRIPTDA